VGDDGLQAGRAACRNLQAVEAAPGDPEHPGPAVAPRLTGEPGEHGDAVVLLLLEILVEEDALRVAAAAQVDADAGIAVAGEIRVPRRVADRSAVVLPVRDVLEQGRHRLGLRRLREPDLRRQAGPVGDGDPVVLDDLHLVGEVAPNRLHTYWSTISRMHALTRSGRCPNAEQ
jgi:hypothetical protein